MMNLKRYKHYIVVNEDGRPMSFDDGQFCFCENHLNRTPFPVNLYTEKEAKKLIKQTVKYRLKNNFTIGEYYLMPVNQELTPTIK